ncbi:MAG: osmoprotectant transport system permease protein [Solirubrobacteraceae bacterium]|jgi:osmoprotectant transport system permease protein|nr:osmoprotectant transport system permease protein [Solirubrobacteraceae bacterium]
MNDFVDALHFIARNGVNQPGDPTLVHLALKHLEIAGAALLVAGVIALPLGVWLGHLRRGSFLAINIANIGRALPELAVIAIGVAFIGLGFLNVLVALVILAVPPMLTNSYVAVAGVDPDVIDAARGIGMREGEILRSVELPLALPIIFAGIRIAAIFVIATATITSLAGYSGTLGDVIANMASYRLSGVVGAAICVAALALAVDGLFALLQHRLTPRGLRLDRRPLPQAGLRPTVPE